MTSSMPTSAATDAATSALSPVSSTGRRPSSRNERIACADVGLTTSDTTTSPTTLSSKEAATTVRAPCATAASVNSRGRETLRSRPTTTRRPSTTPLTPMPSVETNCDTGSTSSTSRTIAAAIGCSDAFSTAAANRSTSSRDTPSAAITSTSVRRPVVTVPVLSSTTVSTRRVDSSTSGPFTRMPSWAPRPVPTSNAVGVASPSAHGHAITSTATAVVTANSSGRPASSHAPNDASAISTTTGTNTADTRSASRCTSALPAWACSTSRAIRASWVSEPTDVADTTSRPPALTVPPTTASPAPTSTGTDSPVTIDRSTAELPSTTRPSVAIRSPGRTTKCSPTWSRPTGTRVSTPSRSTATSLAPNASSDRRAAPALRLDLASSQRPSSRNTVTPTATSR